MHGEQALHDRQAEAGSLLGALDGDRALAEGRQHDRDLVGRNAGPVVAHRQILAAARRPAGAHADLAAGRRELHGVGQKVERDLPHRAFVGVKPRHRALEILDDADVLVAGLELHQVAAILDDMQQHQRLLVELVAAGLDARQVEDLVDQVEQMLPGIVDVARIFAVGLVAHRPEHLVGHHLGEAEDGVERRPQLMAHRGEEARLGEVGFLGAAARLVRHRLGRLQLGDQRVLLACGRTAASAPIC